MRKALTVLALFFLAAVGVAEERTLELQRLGTVGDAPPKDKTLVVEVFRDGTIRAGEKEVTFAELRGVLVTSARAAGTHRVGGWTKVSNLHVVLRADKELPWQAAQWLMTVCAEAKIYRLLWAAPSEKGGDEGAMALYLPVDRGLQPIPQDPPIVMPAQAVLWRKDAGCDPAALYAHLLELKRRAPDGARVIFSLKAGGNVPLGTCLRAVDVALRAGIGTIECYGTAIPPRDADLKKLVAKHRGQPSWGKPVGIRFNGKQLPGKAVKPLPAVARVRGEIAGYGPRGGANPKDAIEEIEEEPEEPEPEVPEEEKPIETEEMEGEAGADGASDAPVPAGGLRRRRIRGPVTAPVKAGLAWLAAHQDEDGRWDADGFMKHDPKADRCDGKGHAQYDPAVTGLAVLAFLGVGYTDRGSRADNPYAKHVRMGLRFLMQTQDDSGCFGSRKARRFFYNHAIATLAMCEAYWMTRNPRYKKPAQEGLNFLAMSRNPYMAWGYPPRTGVNDTSLTTWCVMALKSGKFAGLEVDPDAFEGARQWIDKMTDPKTGRVRYTPADGPVFRPKQLQAKFPPDKSEAMTASGVLCRGLLGERGGSEAVRKGIARVLAKPPVWKHDGSIDLYYWYTATVALRPVGGAAWKQWRKTLTEVVQSNQHMKNSGARAGSWDPMGPWGYDGGRVYATALMTMSLDLAARPR